MATLGHVAIGMALGRLHLAGRTAPVRRQLVSLAAYAALALAPDLDFLAEPWVHDPAAPLAHRVATHSLFAALAAGAVIGAVAGRRGEPGIRTAILSALAVALHGLVDTLSSQGLGVALLWPFSTERLWAPWRIVPGFPAVEDILSPIVVPILAVEFLLFLPFLIYALYPWLRAGREGGSRG
ncbi:MAG TPA: metal-dependent hydrolase [Gemmatimonadales bacterium]|nr:metal-dependent hydrolase [Gemmatimonadales bacterium]